MPAILLYGDTLRYPAMRHEVPLEIMDELLFVERGETKFVLTSSLEAGRIQAAVPGVRPSLYDELGLFELVRQGMSRREAERETVNRALAAWGVDSVVVPHDLPVAVADRVRTAGIELAVDAGAIQARRRVKTAAELAGVRRAQRAAEAAMSAGEALIHGSQDRDGDLCFEGQPLTAEAVRAACRAVCAECGCPAPPDIMVTSVRSGGGHNPGSGPLPAGLPIEIDLWPRDEASGCWADMTRTFAPGLGLSGEGVLVAGDVIAIEPGIEGIDGVGGVRFEDLLLITESGSETLTRYSYEL